MVPVLIHIHPVHTFPPYFLRSILILSSHLCPYLPSSLLTSGFPKKKLHVFFISPMSEHTRPSHPLWFCHNSNIWWSVQVMKLLIMETFPSSNHLLSPDILLSTFIRHPQSISSPCVRNQVAHPYKTTRKITVYFFPKFSNFATFQSV